MDTRLAYALLAVMALAAVAGALLPAGGIGSVWALLVGATALLLAVAGLRRHGPVRHLGWLLVLAGFAGRVAADGVAALERELVGVTGPSNLATGIHLCAYALLATGLLVMARNRRGARDVTVVLDAAIIATGTAVVAAVAVIDPIARADGLDAVSKVMCSAYPVADVFLLGILVRVWIAPQARNRSVNLLTGALAVTFVADALFHLSMVTTGAYEAWWVTRLLWLAAYPLLAAAAWAPSMRSLAETLPDTDTSASLPRRLVLLAAGLTLPAATLVADGALGGEVAWLTVGAASVVMTGLVLARMAGLLHVVQAQAVQLAALARSDALTGAPNRRSWDHALSRACQVSRDTDTRLHVALLDLDHFKRYNDSHGHQAGDRLLREAVALWTDALEGQEFLARYGGEEFALLLPDLSPPEVLRRLDQLRRLTPHGQTFSAGVAHWRPTSEPGVAVAAADAALYRAKRAGRDRVVLATDGVPGLLPVPTIVVQPIVDLATGDVVAEEALSRFDGLDPRQVFADAQTHGQGAELEAAAIRRALELRRPDRRLTVNVSVEALLSTHVDDALPHDLTGVDLEITEHTDGARWTDLGPELERLRSRGCRIAIDDWGHGYSNMDRLVRLRPEIVKLDMSLVHNLASPYHRAMVQAVLTWAEEVGALVCAEGIETDRHRADLVELGVHLGQGYLLGRPDLPDLLGRTVAADGAQSAAWSR